MSILQPSRLVEPEKTGRLAHVEGGILPTSCATPAASVAINAVHCALEPFGVHAIELCLGWVNDELSAAAARRARRNTINPRAQAQQQPAAAAPRLLAPGLPPSTLTVLVTFGRAAFERLSEKRAAALRGSESNENGSSPSPSSPADDEGEEDPLASHVSDAVDAALEALRGCGTGASVAWRAASSRGGALPAPSSTSTATSTSSPSRVAVAAALAAGWAPGAPGVVPCLSPRFGPWAELAAVLVVGGGGGDGSLPPASRPRSPSRSRSRSPSRSRPPPVLYQGVRAPTASRRAAAPCASALAYSKLVSRGSGSGFGSGFGSGGGPLLLQKEGAAAAAAAAARKRLSPSPSPSPPPEEEGTAAAAATETKLSASPPALARASSSSSPNPLLSAFAPKTPPLPGSEDEEEIEEGRALFEDEEMSLDGNGSESFFDGISDDDDDEEDEAEVARKTEARRALSPGHPFSYPPVMLRYLYSRSRKGALRALAEAVEKARARGGGGI